MLTKYAGSVNYIYKVAGSAGKEFESGPLG
jgi:hypothetical protein